MIINLEQYPGYCISDSGDVFPCDRMDKPLCAWTDCLGYRMIVMRINGKRVYKRIHRLLAETFIPNPEGKSQVNHIDGNKLNNSLSNLEWCSNSENTKHGYDNGLYHSPKRCHAVYAKSKSNDEIQTFDSIRSMCDSLDINRKTVTSILKGEKLSNHYPYEFGYL